MDAFYLEIRNVHIASVVASGSLFLLRALAFNLAGARWPMARPLRSLSYAIDTVLLMTGLVLMTIVRQFPFVHGWLTVKLLLLVAYIVLGWHALRASGRSRRIGFTLAAAAVFLFVFSIARTRSPLGIFA